MNTSNGYIKAEVQQAVETVFTELEWDAMFQLHYSRPFTISNNQCVLPNEVNKEFVDNLRNLLKEAHNIISYSDEADLIKEITILGEKFVIATNSRLTILNTEF